MDGAGVAGRAVPCPPLSANRRLPLSKVAPTRESCLPPLDRKPGLYYEVRRRLVALPGVSHACRTARRIPGAELNAALQAFRRANFLVCKSWMLCYEIEKAMGFAFPTGGNRLNSSGLMTPTDAEKCVSRNLYAGLHLDEFGRRNRPTRPGRKGHCRAPTVRPFSIHLLMPNPSFTQGG